MAMVPFFTRFKDLAFKEMRSATVRGIPNLPDGQYGFLELYCDEPECDCRRVVIQVISPTSGSKICATIHYGWESLEFYETWFRDNEYGREYTGATLDPFNPQTENSDALLRLFIQVLQNKAYQVFVEVGPGQKTSTIQQDSRAAPADLTIVNTQG